MRILNTINIASRGLKTNRSRSILTILGIVIGIASIIIIQSIGRGAENLILDQIKTMGTDIVSVEPGKPNGGADMSAFFSDSIKIKDVIALENKNNVPDAIEVTPSVMIPGDVSYLGEDESATIYGTAPGLATIYNFNIAEGDFLSDEDITSKASVVVIGSKIKDNLFGDSDAMGEKIKIKDRNFRIIGILAPKGRTVSMGVDMDKFVLIPYSTATEYLLGTKSFHNITLKISDPSKVADAIIDIQNTMRDSHNISDPSKDDFKIATPEDAIKIIKTITGVLTALLVSVATISLIVGGVGIMNIMLVSVTERTREIGLRKSVGATKKDILSQFLIEAVILTGLGGVVGIISGAIISLLIALILSQALNVNWNFTFPFTGALVGILVSSAVGLVFGIYPAKQAADKSPIEALRYE